MEYVKENTIGRMGNNRLRSVEQIYGTVNWQAVSSFNCGNTTIESFLKQESYTENIEFNCHTKLVYDELNRLTAYYTLKMDSLEQPGQEECPALNLLRIGVEESLQSKGVGSNIIHHIKEIARQISVRYILVDALIDKKEWYENRGFVSIDDESNPSLVYMYCDILDEKVIEDYYENP